MTKVDRIEQEDKSNQLLTPARSTNVFSSDDMIQIPLAPLETMKDVDQSELKKIKEFMLQEFSKE